MVTRGWDALHCIEHFMHERPKRVLQSSSCLQDNREAMVWDDDLKRLLEHGRRMGWHLGAADGWDG